MEKIVFHFIDGSGSHMHPGIAGSIVKKDGSVIIRNGAVGEHHVGNVSHPLCSKGYQKDSRRPGNDFRRILKIRSKGIENIAKSRCRITNPMGDVDPALLSLNGHCTGAVLGLRQGMIDPSADDLFFIDDSMGNVFAQTKADASTAACFDKAIHRPGIKSIFPIHKLRMKSHISLLGRLKSLQVIQSLPGL